MRFSTLFLAAAATFTLSACVVATVPGTSPTPFGGPTPAPQAPTPQAPAPQAQDLRSQIAGRTMLTQVWRTDFHPNGTHTSVIEGQPQSGTWTANGSTVCMTTATFGNTCARVTIQGTRMEWDTRDGSGAGGVIFANLV